jgi:hypothetical protein
MDRREHLDPTESDLLSALYAAYYHTEWEQHDLPAPEELVERRFLVPSLPDAVSVLAKGIHKASDDSHEQYKRALVYNTAARLAFAHLSRHVGPEDGPTAGVRGHLAVLEGAFAKNDCLLPSFRDLMSNLPASPEERFAYAIAHQAFEPITSHRIRSFRSTAGLACWITDVTASVEVERAHTDFDGMLDPRKWKRNVPQVWQRSDLLERPAHQRAPDPTKTRAGTGRVAAGILIEQVSWPHRGNPLVEIDNLLEIEIDVSGSRGRVGFQYCERECIECRRIGDRHLGGIDVDCGHAWARGLSGGWTQLEARKRARFTQPSGPLNRFYNSVAFVWLRLFIEGSVLLGSQLP